MMRVVVLVARAVGNGVAGGGVGIGVGGGCVIVRGGSACGSAGVGGTYFVARALG